MSLYVYRVIFFIFVGLEVCFNLEQNDKGQYTFSSSVGVYGKGETNECVASGQIFEEILPFIERDTPYGPEYHVIMKLHDRFHLNDMHAGTPAQEAIAEPLRKASKAAGTPIALLDLYRILGKNGLYIDIMPDGSQFEYAHGWLIEIIPTHIVHVMQNIIDQGMPALSYCVKNPPIIPPCMGYDYRVRHEDIEM